ncbi:MAG: VOC family protein, partial [Fimbriimonadaceae bacterium]|nr:VOC family protein [Fimbriimonadaceae bacterium]
MIECAPPEGAITFLPTSDLDQTTAFYRNSLGLRMVLDQHTCRIFRISTESFIGFCSHTGDVPQPPESVIVTLLVADVQDWYDRCLQR